MADSDGSRDFLSFINQSRYHRGDRNDSNSHVISRPYIVFFVCGIIIAHCFYFILMTRMNCYLG